MGFSLQQNLLSQFFCETLSGDLPASGRQTGRQLGGKLKLVGSQLSVWTSEHRGSDTINTTTCRQTGLRGSDTINTTTCRQTGLSVHL